MMNEQALNHEWHCYIDHIWLARDSNDHIAVVTCAVALGSPHWITAKECLFDDLEDRIMKKLDICSKLDMPTDQVLYIEYSPFLHINFINRIIKSIGICSKNDESAIQTFNYVNFARSVASRGLYCYDYTSSRKHSCFYECYAAPATPIKINDLPDDLRELAEHFVIPEKKFAALTPEDVECYKKHKMRPFYQYAYQCRSILPEDFHAG